MSGPDIDAIRARWLEAKLGGPGVVHVDCADPREDVHALLALLDRVRAHWSAITEPPDEPGEPPMTYAQHQELMERVRVNVNALTAEPPAPPKPKRARKKAGK